MGYELRVSCLLLTSFYPHYPNPFNPTTTIEFTVPEDGKVTLRIYDVLGREVVTLFDGEMKAGYYQRATFEATRVATGSTSPDWITWKGD